MPATDIAANDTGSPAGKGLNDSFGADEKDGPANVMPPNL